MSPILGFGHLELIIITSIVLYFGYLEFDKRFPPRR